MKKVLMVLISICGLILLNGCGSSTTTPPPVATHFSVTPATTTPSSETAFNITVTALDASGQMVPSYSGTIHFTSSLGQVVQGANATLTGGTGTFSITLFTAGAQTISVTDSMISGTSSQITVGPPLLTITSGNPPNGTVGVAYGGHNDPHLGWIFGFPLSAKYGVPPYKWSWSGSQVSPIPGLFICSSFCSLQGISGAPAIGGTPTTAGTYNVVVTVTDSASSKQSANYTITINPAAAAVAANTTSSLPQEQKSQHHHYKLIDMGTLGGPKSGVNGEPSINVINNTGTIVGVADTSIPTPVAGGFNPIGNPDFYISHAFVWSGESLKDLGTLPGGNYSFAAAINQGGQIVGASENNQIDPASGNPQFRAVLWQNDKILNLGTLGGTASFATTLNDRGQVIGNALNDVPDPLSIFGSGDGTTLTQTRAFLWQNGKLNDLGTLGGPDSWAMFINDIGQVAGTSYTSDVIDPNTQSPPSDPFLWMNGKMQDLGNLGGTNGFLGPQFVQALNNRGQVVGWMALPGDQINHAFLWDGEKLSDLGTLGGSWSLATGINEAGEVAGMSALPGDQVKHAFLWRDGAMTDLGTVPGDPCSFAYNINSKGQIVGGSQNAECDPFTHAVLWENGEPGVDLNTLIPSGSNLQLVVAYWINDHGEIVGLGHDPTCPNGDSCDAHAYVLIPCDRNHPDIVGCDYSLVAATPSAQLEASQNTQTSTLTSTVKLSPAEVMTRFRSMTARRNGRFGSPQASQK